MRNVLTKEEIKRLEQQAEKAGISLAGLMENAGEALARQVQEMLPEGGRVTVLCGGGNNGGDGYICAAVLENTGKYAVSVILCAEPGTSLAVEARKKLPGGVQQLSGSRDRKQAMYSLSRTDLILDAIFGFGFHGELTGTAGELIRFANRQTCKKLAADLPSGAVCDTGETAEITFHADVTVTFHAWKPACVSYPAKAFCGETVVREVGVPAEITAAADSRLSVSELADMRELLPLPPVQSNKGSRGRLLLVCGSYGMAGACVMAARAALRSGVGLLDIFTTERLYPLLATQLPEAIFTVVPEPEAVSEMLKAALEKATACVMGCGLGQDSEVLCGPVLQSCKVPLLIDADGLNFLSRHPQYLKDLPKDTVLTPHPGELSRLTGISAAGINANRLKIARETAEKFGTVLLLKGAGTVIAKPGGMAAVNPTGNLGMAKGGSGDVLSGIIGALLSQGTGSFQAAVAGAYLHGLAGDRGAAEFSMRAVLPTDLIEQLPAVYKMLE